MKRKYTQRYRGEWEQDPSFKSWLCKSKVNTTSAYCKACNCEVLSRVASLKEHMATSKHRRNMKGCDAAEILPCAQILHIPPEDPTVEEADVQIPYLLEIMAVENPPLPCASENQDVATKRLPITPSLKNLSRKRKASMPNNVPRNFIELAEVKKKSLDLSTELDLEHKKILHEQEYRHREAIFELKVKHMQHLHELEVKKIQRGKPNGE